MKTLLYQRPLAPAWHLIPYYPGMQCCAHDRLHLLVIESVDDIPGEGRMHHVSVSHQGWQRASDQEVRLAILVFMDASRPVQEDAPLEQRYVRHLWQPIERMEVS